MLQNAAISFPGVPKFTLCLAVGLNWFKFDLAGKAEVVKHIGFIIH